MSKPSHSKSYCLLRRNIPSIITECDNCGHDKCNTLKKNDFVTICVDHDNKCLYFLKNGIEGNIIGKNVNKSENGVVNGIISMDFDNFEWYFMLRSVGCQCKGIDNPCYRFRVFV